MLMQIMAACFVLALMAFLCCGSYLVEEMREHISPSSDKMPPCGLWWVDPGWMPGAHQSRSITPPPQLDGGGRKYNKRLVGQDKDSLIK